MLCYYYFFLHTEVELVSGCCIALIEDHVVVVVGEGSVIYRGYPVYFINQSTI